MKVGIVGCGQIAEAHLRHVPKRKSVASVTLADLDRRRMEDLAKRYGLGASRTYTDYATMLREERPDVVHVLTPPATHAEYAIEAMNAGCHVLVEKPMALTVDEADAMVAASTRNRVKLCVDHNILWEPLMLRARRLVDSGNAGSVRHVDVCYHFDAKRISFHGDAGSARRRWLAELPGGLVFDLLPHPVSILLHFLNEPDSISAIAKGNGVLADAALDELRVLFEGREATGALSVSLGVKPDCFTTTIYTTETTIHVNLTNLTLVVRRNRNVPRKLLRPLDSIEHAARLLSCTFVNGLRVLAGKMPPPEDVGAVIAGFYESIESGTEPPVDGEKGRAVVRVSQRIARAVERAEAAEVAMPGAVALSPVG